MDSSQPSNKHTIKSCTSTPKKALSELMSKSPKHVHPAMNHQYPGQNVMNIVQHNRHLCLWHVEYVGIRPPPFHKG